MSNGRWTIRETTARFTLVRKEDPEYYGLSITNMNYRVAHNVKREVCSRKFANGPIYDIGIYTGAYNLFAGQGWQDILYAGCQTYKTITLKFFSTVEVHGKQEDPSIPNDMTFKIGNKNDALKDTNPETTRALWDELVLEGFRGYSNKTNLAVNIRNPIFWYGQKVLANTLLARHEARRVWLHDLWILANMLMRRKVNFATTIMNRFCIQANSRVGSIYMGGRINSIAWALDVDLNDLSSPKGPMAFDLRTLHFKQLISFRLG